MRRILDEAYDPTVSTKGFLSQQSRRSLQTAWSKLKDTVVNVLFTELSNKLREIRHEEEKRTVLSIVSRHKSLRHCAIGHNTLHTTYLVLDSSSIPDPIAYGALTTDLYESGVQYAVWMRPTVSTTTLC